VDHIDQRDRSAARAARAAQAVPAGARVLHLGPDDGLEARLPDGCRYRRAQHLPEDLSCDLLIALDVLEAQRDLAAFLKGLRAAGRPVVASYRPAGEGAPAPGPLSRPELMRLMLAAGFNRGSVQPAADGEVVIRLEPTGPPIQREKVVWTLSFANIPNFGDRLGVQVLSRVLPAHARVRHLFHDHLPPPPDETPDLLIVGLGNSLFGPLLNDDLERLVERAPVRLGIFGTQYRAGLPAERLERLIDRLDLWFARYEEDALLYGRGQAKVRHLGDWMIDAFPMARPTRDARLEIDAAFASDGPLDRLIAEIQSYRQVHATRLHPLICALTSAEAVSYAEQAEYPGWGVSGKFGAMLVDVFGWRHPPGRMWAVDRAAVVAYKAKVAANIADLRAELASRLA
jgi:hypothetical protein